VGNQSFIIESESKISEVSALILDALEHKLVLFIGDLGAGKTTIIKSMLEHLGSEDPGSSPSYSIINQYKIADEIVHHIDLYRLNSADEAFQLGFEEFIYNGSFCFIEWPQIVKEFIDPPFNVITIEILENNQRKIILS